MAEASERFAVKRAGSDCVLVLGGRWLVADGVPSLAPLEAAFGQEPAPERVTLEAGSIREWDSSVVAFALGVADLCRAHKIPLDFSGLPEGLRKLVHLAEAVPERDGAARQPSDRTLLAELEQPLRQGYAEAHDVIAFMGEILLSLGRLLTGRARFPMADFWLQVELTGSSALPIVSVIAFLVGLIIGFVGAIQLRQFGAGLYIANLVGLAVAREMAPVMTAIVLAGRTGAAFAAELGAMESNEEVDALSVLSISAIDYLVLPRLLALTCMMPLLCLYADLLGMVGGYAVGASMLGITGAGFLHQLDSTLPFTQVAVGVGKSMVFALIVAISGCFQGLNSGRSAADVGTATTSAVVNSILWLVVADGVFAVVLQGLNL